MKEVFKKLEQKLETVCEEENAKGALFGNSSGFCVASNKLSPSLAGSAYSLLTKSTKLARNPGDAPVVHVEGHTDVYLIKGNGDYFILAKKSRG
jgi:Ragulator complex protein LAMTOR5